MCTMLKSLQVCGRIRSSLPDLDTPQRSLSEMLVWFRQEAHLLVGQ